MSKTSRVPIFKSPPEDVWKNFPDLKSKSFEALLGPGDMLFMPPGWWHAMGGEGSRPGWSVSMWF
jgi:ribosomal protein L16 Arg81 hydroxylase